MALFVSTGILSTALTASWTQGEEEGEEKEREREGEEEEGGREEEDTITLYMVLHRELPF